MGTRNARLRAHFSEWLWGYYCVIEDDAVVGVPLGSAVESRKCALEGGAVEGGDGFVLGPWLGGAGGTCLVMFSRKGCGG